MIAEKDKLKVYCETSFICYLTGDATDDAKIAADQAYTRQWWNNDSPKCDVYVSQYVVEEASIGRADAVARRIDLLRKMPLVEVDVERVTQLARKLIDGHALPEGETTDALHIAAASITGMDVLLTWNCRHMANPHTLPKTRKIIAAAGSVCPLIMTPKTFIENERLEVADD